MKDRETHEKYMQFALELARAYKGRTAPNPTVGAVVVRQGRIVGFGAHRGKGHEHAEVVALKEAGELARGADLYVTLEPHSFHGTTPPCTEAIKEAGIQRVIVATRDPHPRVKGEGIRILREAGIEVIEGVLEAEARALNEAYFKFHETGMPWVTVKIAATLDGWIAEPSGHARWVTSPEARRFVHQLRGEHDAILVGAETVRIDDPSLTAREVFAYRQPTRLILSRSLAFPEQAKVFQGIARTIVISEKAGPVPEGVVLWRIEPMDFETILQRCASEGIQSVLVEGGAQVFGEVLASGLWDRLIVMIAPKLLGEGLPMIQGWARSLDDPAIGILEKTEILGPDVALFYRNPMASSSSAAESPGSPSQPLR